MVAGVSAPVASGRGAVAIPTTSEMVVEIIDSTIELVSRPFSRVSVGLVTSAVLVRLVEEINREVEVTLEMGGGKKTIWRARSTAGTAMISR